MAVGDKEWTPTEAVVRNADGELETKTVYVPSDGNVPGLIGERSYRCSICGLAFKEHDVTHFRGKVYGIPCGDHKDINSILRSETAKHGRAVRSEERVSDFDFEG